MKNYFKSFIIVLFLVSFNSCNTNEWNIDQGVDSIEEENSIMMQAIIANLKNVSEPLTRTIIDDSNQSELQLVWSENDTIGIFPDRGSQVAFPMESGAGTKLAEFNGGGWGLKSSSSYSAYYPLIGRFYLDKTRIPILLEGQVQIGNATHEHVGGYDFMAAVDSHLSEYGTVVFNFQHLVCILHLSITMPHAGKYTKLFLESNGNLITECTLNLIDGEVTTIKESPIQVLNLKDVLLNPDNLVLDSYVVMRPKDLTSNTLTVKVMDDVGNVYAIDRGLGGRVFEAGAIYHATRYASLASESTGLPLVYINTPNNESITSKDIWLDPLSTITVINKVLPFFRQAPSCC